MFKKIVASFLATFMFLVIFPTKVNAEENFDTDIKNENCISCKIDNNEETQSEEDDPFIRNYAEWGKSYNDVFILNNEEYVVFNADDISNIYFVKKANINESNKYEPLNKFKSGFRRAPCLPGDPGYPGCAHPGSGGSTTNQPDRRIIDVKAFVICIATAILGEFGVATSKSLLTYFAEKFTFKVIVQKIAAAYGLSTLAILAVVNGLICLASSSRPIN